MPKDTRLIGNTGEDAVVSYLEQQGFKVLIRNYSVHNVGEIDIAAKKDGVLYIIEVKTRSVKNIDTYGSPESFITRGKKSKVLRTARHLIAHLGEYDSDVVFMAASVVTKSDGSISSIELIEI